MRDIASYSKAYRELPFESIQLSYRRKMVLNQILEIGPESILEIGCGEKPLFIDVPFFKHTVIEPSLEFYNHAKRMASARNVELINSFLEDYDFENKKFDMIVASCVLHEVESPQAFLAAIKSVCSQNSVVHINVPNALSMHRILAKEMGIIPDVFAQSNTQEIMQQRSKVYDISNLINEIERAGFVVKNSGSIFIKPFSHKQMQELINIGFIDEAMLDGFDKLISYFPDFGSEIWVNVVLR